MRSQQAGVGARRNGDGVFRVIRDANKCGAAGDIVKGLRMQHYPGTL